MKHIFGTALAVVALAATTQMAFGSTSASASVSYRLKNVATGKCLTAVNTAPLPTALRMETCGTVSSGKWQNFFPAGNTIQLGTPTVSPCLMVQSNANSGSVFTPVLAACLQAGYKKLTYSGVSSSSLILNGCYLGNYASGDTYASCGYSAGNNTKWNWVPY